MGARGYTLASWLVTADAAGVAEATVAAHAAHERASTDVDLVRRLRQRDAGAFATLYDRYAAQVHGVARAILRDDHLAEEATHDVFLGLWQQPQNFEPARGSLLRVARNRAIDLLRRRREQPFAPPATAESEAADPLDWLVDPDPDPAEQAISSVVGQEVRAALARLTPDQRHLLELAYFGGLTQREIAAQLERPLGTVKTQIRTAMQRLAALLPANDAAAYRTRAPEARP